MIVLIFFFFKLGFIKVLILIFEIIVGLLVVMFLNIWEIIFWGKL